MSCSFLCTLEANKKKGTHKSNKKEKGKKKTQRKERKKGKKKRKKSLNANSIKID